MKKDGGPAFPVVGMSQIGNQPITSVFNGGMSLRDYFAAQALEGLLCACCAGLPGEAASNAYKYADAMLEARDK